MSVSEWGTWQNVCVHERHAKLACWLQMTKDLIDKKFVHVELTENLLIVTKRA